MPDSHAPSEWLTSIAHHRDQIRRLAIRMSQGDRDLADDLQQEGLIALWKIHQTSAPAILCRKPYEQGAIMYRMLAVLRAERRTKALVQRMMPDAPVEHRAQPRNRRRTHRNPPPRYAQRRSKRGHPGTPADDSVSEVLASRA